MAKTTASARRNEEVARHTAQEEHREEHDTDTEGGDQGGNGDLRCAFQNRVVKRMAFFQEALDVFDGHGGVVDQDSDGQRQSASVMMLMVSPSALRVQMERQNRERNGDRDDQRAAPTAKEDQDHQAR